MIFSSHQLDLVERLCDRVGIISRGSMREIGTVDELRGKGDGRIEVFAPDAPVGIFPDLIVRLSGQLHGQPVSYCIGRGGTLRIEPRGALVRDPQGRPLSRLEVLQKASAPASGAGK